MRNLDTPMEDLHRALGHAVHAGFSDIQYVYRSPKDKEVSEIRVRRPTNYDINVYAMFPQTWGSTALGHGGIGGSAMTSAYTIVIKCDKTQEYLVYFGGIFCYKVKRSYKGIHKFLEDVRNQDLASKNKCSIYGDDNNEI